MILEERYIRFCSILTVFVEELLSRGLEHRWSLDLRQNISIDEVSTV